MKHIVVAIGLLAAATSQASSALARGALHLLDPAWNPEHIRNLPAEVRNALAHICKDPQAAHQFASYSQGLRVLVLHFEHFRFAVRVALRLAASIKFIQGQTAAIGC